MHCMHLSLKPLATPRLLALMAPLPAQLSTVVPGSLPLALRVRPADVPQVSLRDGKATATLQSTIDVVTRRPGFPVQTLFSLDSVSVRQGDGVGLLPAAAPMPLDAPHLKNGFLMCL